MEKQQAYFISGTMCDERLWHAVWSELSESIIPHYIDITGCDGFEAINQQITHHLEGAPQHLIGFSLGAYSALNYALQNPHKIASLTLIAASAEGLSEKELKFRANYVALLEKNPYKGMTLSRTKAFLSPTNQMDSSLIQTIQEMDRALGKEVLIRQLKTTSKRENLLEKLPTLLLPTLLIGGVDDKLATEKNLRQMQERLPNSKLVIAEHAGHMIPLEQASLVAEQLSQWVLGD